MPFCKGHKLTDSESPFFLVTTLLWFKVLACYYGKTCVCFQYVYTPCCTFQKYHGVKIMQKFHFVAGGDSIKMPYSSLRFGDISFWQPILPRTCETLLTNMFSKSKNSMNINASSRWDIAVQLLSYTWHWLLAQGPPAKIDRLPLTCLTDYIQRYQWPCSFLLFRSRTNETRVWRDPRCS